MSNYCYQHGGRVLLSESAAQEADYVRVRVDNRLSNVWAFSCCTVSHRCRHAESMPPFQRKHSGHCARYRHKRCCYCTVTACVSSALLLWSIVGAGKHPSVHPLSLTNRKRKWTHSIFHNLVLPTPQKHSTPPPVKCKILLGDTAMLSSTSTPLRFTRAALVGFLKKLADV